MSPYLRVCRRAGDPAQAGFGREDTGSDEDGLVQGMVRG